MANVQAVANQVHTRVGPPSAKAGSTTAALSRRMSGQSKVDESAVAAAANASAPARKRAPVIRRRPLLPLAAVAVSTRTGKGVRFSVMSGLHYLPWPSGHGRHP